MSKMTRLLRGSGLPTGYHPGRALSAASTPTAPESVDHVLELLLGDEE